MKRFYKNVAVGEAGGAFHILLDGKTLKSPARATLALPSRALAEAVAEEWRGAGEAIDTHSMLLTRLAFAALDGLTAHRADIMEHLLSFGRSDLLCYRAEAPAALTAREVAAWDPLLEWVAVHYGAGLKAVNGITFVEQPQEALHVLEQAIAKQDDFVLAALHAVATITGSLVLALALCECRLDAAQTFAAATVDESFQAEKWGRDDEAQARFDRHAAELASAERFLRLLS